MNSIKLKNQKSLNSCSKCGLLTYNGKNSLCNACKPVKRVSGETEKRIANRQSKKLNKSRPKQLQKYSKAYGKTIKHIENTLGKLIIYFTDNTFLLIAGDNDGDGGYVSLITSKKQEEKNDHFRWNGYNCEDCHHQWLPRKKNTEPKRCPKCGKSRIVSLVTLRFRKIEEDKTQFGGKL